LRFDQIEEFQCATIVAQIGTELNSRELEMTNAELVEWIDNRFEAMMTRPGMWAGDMRDPAYISGLEGMVIQLLEIRRLCLNKDATFTGSEYMQEVRKIYPKVGSRFGLGEMVPNELTLIINLRTIWEKLK
jgi:hypothetical protein